MPHHHHHHRHHAHHHSTHISHHHPTTVVYPPFQPKSEQVMALNVDGVSDSCGCAAACGCTPNVAKIPKQYRVPNSAESFLSLEDLNALVNDVNQILERNYIPPLPLMFLHFCLPFSPICIMGCFTSKKQKALRELVEARNAVMKDCHWELNSDALHIPTYPLLSLISHHSLAVTSSVVPVTTVIPLAIAAEHDTY